MTKKLGLLYFKSRRKLKTCLSGDLGVYFLPQKKNRFSSGEREDHPCNSTPALHLMSCVLKQDAANDPWLSCSSSYQTWTIMESRRKKWSSTKRGTAWTGCCEKKNQRLSSRWTPTCQCKGKPLLHDASLLPQVTG